MTDATISGSGAIDETLVSASFAQRVAAVRDVQITKRGTLVMTRDPLAEIAAPAEDLAVTRPVPPRVEVPTESARARALLDEISMLVDLDAIQPQIDDASSVDLQTILDKLRRDAGVQAALQKATPMVAAPAEPRVPVARTSDAVLAWSCDERDSLPPAPAAPVTPRTAHAVRQPQRKGRALIHTLGALLAVAIGGSAAIVVVGPGGEERAARMLSSAPPVVEADAVESETVEEAQPVVETESDVRAATVETQVPQAAAPSATVVPVRKPVQPRTASVRAADPGDAKIDPRAERARALARAQKALASGHPEIALLVLKRASANGASAESTPWEVR